MFFFFFFSSRRRHTRWPRDWSSDVCSSDLADWPEDVPSAKEIIQALEEQKERIELFFNDKLDQKASTVRDVNGTLLDKVDSSLQFVTWHEGIHLGVTNSLGKVLE